MSTLAPLGPSRAQPRQPLSWRLQRWLSNWLPVALLALLALATTWLVRQTPLPEGPMGEPAARSKPDYTMSGFELQRFAADGSSQAWLRGDQLRHFPQGDRIEIDGLRLRAQAPDGGLLLAEAAKAAGPLDGSRLLLSGGVQVRRFAPGADPEQAAPLMQLSTASLLAENEGQRLSSRQPTEVVTPQSRIQAGGGFRYDHPKSRLDLSGPTQVTLPPRTLIKKP